MNTNRIVKLADNFYVLAYADDESDGNIKYNIDKSDMYSSGTFPEVIVSITLNYEHKAKALFQQIKNNKMLNRISPWKILGEGMNVDKNELYTTIALDRYPVADRYGIVNRYIDRIDTELRKMGITLGKIIPPRSDEEDYPSEDE